MKILNLFFVLSFFALLSLPACKDNDPTPDPDPIVENPNKYVNDWIYEQMNIYYLWNTKIPKSPDYKLTPDKFFTSLLSTYNATSNPDGDRFSWIQENYVDLLNSLGGVVSHDIGFEYVRVKLSDSSPVQYYLLVLYPKLGSDAQAKGIEKGRWVVAIDGQDITESNFKTLTGGTGTKSLKMADWIFDSTSNEYKLTLSGDVSVQMHENFAEIPVYMDSVYTTPNNTKVGYLVYNFFARDKGDGTHYYDKLLMNTLSDLQAKGATELILDLRYNGGGALSTATALASALVPERTTDKIFLTVNYNSLVQGEYIKMYGSDFNKTTFIDQITSEGFKIADVPKLNLPRLYILVSNWTASASEMIINGLKPYMDVILIGETTVGKNVGSVSLYEENDAKNKWGMQPIIAKYYNSLNQSDFTSGFIPNYEVDELEDLRIVPFGDTNDVMLNKALTVIGGSFNPVLSRSPRTNMANKMQKVANSSSILEKPGRNVLNDDVRGEEIRDLMNRYNNQ
ncbi:MAG: S41 family peptidase [Paludibacteraceae bacterium]